MVALRAAVRLTNYKRRLRRRLDAAYRTLVADPHDFGLIADGAEHKLRLPAGSRLAVAFSEPTPAGAAVFLVGANESSTHPALEAGEVYPAIWGEETFEVDVINVNITGDVYLFQIDPTGHFRLIATGQTDPSRLRARIKFRSGLDLLLKGTVGADGFILREDGFRFLREDGLGFMLRE